jgi:hypothetical protein
MKRLVLSVLCGVSIAAASVATALAQMPNITGTWQVQQTGANGSTQFKITLTQSGNSFVGHRADGTGFTGTFVNDTQIDGKWHGPGGAGWLTIYASPDGHSFNGTWGYNGRAANGSFVGNEVLPPSPVTAAGEWNVKGAGGPTAFVGAMKCTQSGPTVVCHAGPIILNGKFRTKDKVRATWTGPTGSGWFSFWFNDDNNSFNGVWGKGADSTPAVGRVVGERAMQ